MTLVDQEHELLQEALAALAAEAGISLDIVPGLKKAGVDAIVKVRDQDAWIDVDIKKGLRPANISAVTHRLKNFSHPGLLVTDYVSPNIGKQLKEQNIQFVDCCGNAYLNLPPLYVYVIGKKPEKDTLDFKKSKNKAFDTSGLKLIYGFLCDDTLVNASYREISERTGVALGAIGKLLMDLKDAGYLINNGNLKWHGLINRRKLLDRWVESYPEKLRPKLFVGEFISDEKNWWDKMEIENFGGYWSGEVAAAKYTDYLRPQVVTVYLPESAGKKLFSVAKLRKAHNVNDDEYGLIKIYRPFWPEQHASAKEAPGYLRKDSVNPILIYADLVASADSRNLEAARRLYESTIAEYIGND